MDDRGRREEEARREAEERRRANPRIDSEGRTRNDPSFEDESYDDRYYTSGGSRSVRGSSGRGGSVRGGSGRGRSERGGSQTGGRLSEAANRISNRVSGRGQRSSEGGDQSSGLYDSDTSANVLGAAVAELIGTFILVFTGTAVVAAAALQRPTAGPAFYDSLAVALAFGLALAAIVAAIGHVSGAHVNPAVTLALAATRKFAWQYVPIYIGAQLVGALLAAIATWITYGRAARELVSLAATFPAENVGDLRALVVEILVTFILVFVVISVATDDRAPAGVAPLAVGFALACGVFIAGPITGGSLNPARTLGPMIVAGNFAAVWVYIVGPIIGAVLAALVYDRFASRANASG